MKPKIFSAFLVLTFLLSLPLARADETADQYLVIFDAIQKADTMANTGQPTAALAKYQRAYNALINFQKTYPDWNPKIMTYRMAYLNEKIGALSEKALVAGTNSPDAKAAPAGGGAGGDQVKLIEPGAEPRKKLRLHPTEGDKQTLVMNMQMDMEMSVAGNKTPSVKIPPMIMTMEITPTKVSPEGDISYDTVITDATVAEDAEAMPQVTQVLKSSLASIKGMSGSGTITSRGIGKTMELKVPEGADPQVRQMVDQTRDLFSKGTSPMPEEAVGQGAKWEVKMPIKSGGVAIQQTTTTELVSVDGERITTKSLISQTAGKQQIQSPMAPGMKVDLSKMTGSGTGTSTLDMTRLLPIEAVVDYNSDLSMSVNVAGQNQPMSTKVVMNMKMQTK